ncbi:MAG TPA: non-canonical purine NTP pyrophosphatase, RdgB/HAM1 family [Lachnospiraceae bacterium]|nr:non-canonical purine NTP pyrophosphatase, RdgB/HAM1 family [Lachnospiraceae bacterium]
MKEKIIFATTNEGKLKEIREVMGERYLVISLKEAGIDAQADETGSTFEENALIKAKAVSALCNELVLADDSGLEIDFLDKAPGIYSSRYMGEDTPYDIKNAKILELMKDVPDEKRTARFVCAVAAVKKGEDPIVVRETIEGIVARKTEGENGFGYDPLFFYPPLGKTTAQLSMEEKNKVSHRGKALKAMLERLEGRGTTHRI